jgi:hypothetical protein
MLLYNGPVDIPRILLSNRLVDIGAVDPGIQYNGPVDMCCESCYTMGLWICAVNPAIQWACGYAL